MLLNTSFNNNAEPIVTSARDAIVCYLTTGLPTLVVGDFWVSKRPFERDTYRRFRPALPSHVFLRRGREASVEEAPSRSGQLFEELFQGLYRQRPDTPYFLGDTHGARKTPISPGMASMLAAADGFTSVEELMQQAPADRPDDLLDELLALWASRRVQLRPAS
jgi:carbamoyltransferase